MSDTVELTFDNEIAIISLKNPPVNALSQSVRRGILNSVKEIKKEKNVKVVIIRGKGNAFCAGADISEFSNKEKLAQGPDLPGVIQHIEDLDKPVIASIHGVALGGGLEVALGCHYRFSTSSTKVGLPEVQLGIIPGAGGTQRLPRLIGVQKSLEIIMTGKMVRASSANKMGIIDVVIPNVHDSDSMLNATIQHYRNDPSKYQELRRVSSLTVKNEYGEMVYDMAIQTAKDKARGFNGPIHCINAIKASEKPFNEGMATEKSIIVQAMQSTQAQAQQYLFFAQRQTSKHIPKGKASKVNSVGIIGASTMGIGIAICFLEVGIPVVILDIKQEYIDRAVNTITKTFNKNVKRKRMTQEKVDQLLSNLNSTLSYSDFSDVDLVIEAVFENVEIKQTVFRNLDQHCKPSAILATNTSSLDIDLFARVTQRPEKVIGTHFFSPANKMRLLEVVKCSTTSNDTISTVMKVGKRIRKICVLVGNCFGFACNRMFFPYGSESNFLLEEGCFPEQVDKVLYDFGLPMGPFQMQDLSGNDIGWKIRKMRKPFIPKTERYSNLSDSLCADYQRFGQKVKKGWYDYDVSPPVVSDEVKNLIISESNKLGITRRNISDEEIEWRCILPIINEGFKILEEGVSYSPSDIDTMIIFGYGFPAYRGGPMYYADKIIGLPKILSLLQHYSSEHPNSSHLIPSKLLVKLVESNQSLFSYWNKSKHVLKSKL
eukprot:TRINITY_DN9377_c0_g1_i1.p1 TRINITY_DN9377_c0_g1~~TRINITY_DN9377_c0_g1_i1.p1  ORF type:complete len:714 (+),score=247.65 TRINITY_DN9377_c0_g1_i1:104-2245(+)